MTQQHGTGTPVVTRDPRLREGWRAAAAAYREAYGAPSNLKRGKASQCYTAAIAALHKVVPELSDREAMLETVQAIAYASREHPKWLYALHRPAQLDR